MLSTRGMGRKCGLRACSEHCSGRVGVSCLPPTRSYGSAVDVPGRLMTHRVDNHFEPVTRGRILPQTAGLRTLPGRLSACAMRTSSPFSTRTHLARTPSACSRCTLLDTLSTRWRAFRPGRRDCRSTCLRCSATGAQLATMRRCESLGWHSRLLVHRPGHLLHWQRLRLPGK